RKDENWTIASPNNAPANAGEIRRFIDTLQNERVTKFVEDVASNLPTYGLDKPQLQLTFSSFASENTEANELKVNCSCGLSRPYVGKFEATSSTNFVTRSFCRVSIKRRISPALAGALLGLAIVQFSSF